MISLLIHMLIVLIVLGLVYWVFTLIPLPQPIKQIATVIIVVICALWLIYMLLPLADAPTRWLR
jgi:hypothetical protein